jgi:hypothetical protein
MKDLKRKDLKRKEERLTKKNQLIVSKSIKKSQKNTAFHKISE